MIELTNTKGTDPSIRASVLAPAYFVRGLAKVSLQDLNGANSDITQAAKLFRQQGQMEQYQLTIAILEKIKTPTSEKKDPKLSADPNVALVEYDKEIALTPQKASLYVDRGVLKSTKLNDINGALADYNKAISLDPKVARSYFVRGFLKQNKLNDVNGALMDYNQAISLDPKYTIAYFLRGNLKCQKLNDVNGAIADYNQAM